MESTLCVADHVLSHFHDIHPEITNTMQAYIKSDNAGASGPETEYVICKRKGGTLLRHDYNEPQKGKDQADRESAVVRRYVQA